MNEDAIRTEEVPRCPLCGNGKCEVLYAGLRDRLFGVPGEWTLRRCRRCGLVFLDPRPIPEDVQKAYSGYCTHSISEPPKSNQPKKTSLARRIYRMAKDGYLGKRWGYYNGLEKWQIALAPLIYLLPNRRADLDFSVMHLKATPGGRLVDVGCGNGTLIERLKNLGWRVEGVELDGLAAQVARRRNLEVYYGTLEARNYPDESFDAVTISHVIEHVYDPLQLLRECHRILKPQGRLIVATPNLSSWGHKYFKAAWLGLDPPRHLQVFTSSLLVLLAKRAGFHRFELSTTIREADEVFIASRSIQRTGSYIIGGPQSRTTRILARGVQLLEWAVLKVKCNVGEEIVVVLEK